MFNIAMLKKIFAPSFQLHDIKQTGKYEATTRWTMIMKPTFNKSLGFQWLWDPELIFTGVSIMGVNPKNGCPHQCVTQASELSSAFLQGIIPCIASACNGACLPNNAPED